MKSAIALLVLLLAGCVEEPTPKEAAAAARVEAVTPQKEIEENARKIEQAAEEAVKLIEAETKAETDRQSAEAE